MVAQHNTNNTTQKDTTKTNQTTSLSAAQEPKIKEDGKKAFDAAQLAAVQEFPPENPQITPNTTYSDLKAMVPDATGQRTPAGKDLISDPNQKVLISVKEDNHTIIVYESGFFAYIDYEGRPTARAVHNCSTMYFPDGNGKFKAVPESEYKDKEGNPLPFTVILEHFGERNIEDQERQKKKRKHAISLDGDINYMKVSGKHSGTKGQLDEKLVKQDFADRLCDILDGTQFEKTPHQKMLEALPAAMNMLTAKQREVVLLYYGKGMTEEQVAAEIGISRDSVHDRLEGAKKKFEKFSKGFK